MLLVAHLSTPLQVFFRLVSVDGDWANRLARSCGRLLLFVDVAHCRLQLLPPALVVLGYVCVCVCQDGWTPYRIARSRGHADVAAVLAEAGGRER
jgi:hypothetical protein